MKTYNQINDKIASGKAVVLTAEEMKDYIDKYGVRKAAKEIDVVTTATFGPMCSSGVFLNFGHSKPKIRITQCWLDGVMAYSGIAAGKDLDSFKKQGLSIILVTLIALIGTFVGSAIIAHIVMKYTGVI